jgi:hypothetical protein
MAGYVGSVSNVDSCFTSDDMNRIPLGSQSLAYQGIAEGLIAGVWGVGDVLPAHGLPSIAHRLPA